MQHQCTRCLLDTEIPGVRITSSGLCSVCTSYDKLWGDWDRIKGKRKEELECALENARSQKKAYDVLVPFSGGKDSSYVLYLCRKVYNLHCLAVTFDNGFLTDHARHNIARACEILDVDHVYYGLSKPALMRLYRDLFLKTGFFCPVCMSGIGVATYRTQAAFDIPLAITGSCFRTEEYVAPEFFLTGETAFLTRTIEDELRQKEALPLLSPVGHVYRMGTFSIKAMLARMAGRKVLPYINMPDYLDWDYDKIYATIIEHLDWQIPDIRAEHGDCKVDHIVHYIRQQKFPAIKPERLRFSKLVTCGRLTREEAQQKIDERSPSADHRPDLEFFLDALSITNKDLENAIADPLRHMKYIRTPNNFTSRLRTIKNDMLRKMRNRPA
ncbi:MAG: hypothetical protein A4E69_00376 [Syntrophus sp. PtaB.Bin138]|nr:MAG: hypothetical protein A4E69_00376 [Syntrophus sp. PtaB.Bin138]